MATATEQIETAQQAVINLYPAEVRDAIQHYADRIALSQEAVRHHGADRKDNAEQARLFYGLIVDEIRKHFKDFPKPALVEIAQELGLRIRSSTVKGTVIDGLVQYTLRTWPNLADRYNMVRGYASALDNQADYIDRADRWLTDYATREISNADAVFGIYCSVDAALKFYGQIYHFLRGNAVPGLFRDGAVTDNPMEIEAALHAVGQRALTDLIRGEKTVENSLAQINAEMVYPFMLTELARKEVVRVVLGALQYAAFEPDVRIPIEHDPYGWRSR